MKNKIKLICTVLLIVVANFAFMQSIDGKKSIVTFKVPKTDGTISGMKGEIKFNESDLENSFFKVSIDPNTIDTDNKKRDKHLRTEDFFHVDVFPEITFTSKSITKNDDGYMTIGILKLHGVEQEVKIKFNVTDSEKDKTFIGHFQINQKNYDMSKKDYLVDIEIICVLND